MIKLSMKDLYAVAAKMSKKEKMIAYVTITIVIFAVMDRIIIDPIYTNMRTLDEQISQRKASIAQSVKILSQKNRIASESAKYTAYLSGGASSKSDEDEMTVLMKKVEALANKSSVYLIDMKPSGVKTVGVFKKFMVSISIEAQMEQLADFLYSLEKVTQLITVEKCDIAPKSKESSVARCNITISRIVMS